MYINTAYYDFRNNIYQLKEKILNVLCAPIFDITVKSLTGHGQTGYFNYAF